MKTKNTDIIMQNKVFVWIALATGLILLVPFLAMQFTDEVAWTLSDFVIAGTLLFGTGLTYVLVARKTEKLLVSVRRETKKGKTKYWQYMFFPNIKVRE